MSMIKIVTEKIDEAAILDSVKSDDAGACLLFSGTTRRVTGDKVTQTLSYQAYEEMAIKLLNKLRDDAMSRWPLINFSIVHRVGEVPVGQTSVVVAVSSPHRIDAFQAAAWVMDTLKQDVPIWKQEVYQGGKQEWVHPENKAEAAGGE